MISGYEVVLCGDHLLEARNYRKSIPRGALCEYGTLFKMKFQPQEKKHYAKFTVTANERSARFFKRHRFSYPSKVKVKLNIISGEKTDFQLTTNYPSAVVVGENTNLSLALTPHRANGSLSCWR